MIRPTTSPFPAWLLGVLSCSSLLVINVILLSIAIITRNNVSTGLEGVVMACNSSACSVLIALLMYKTLAPSCMSNDIESDSRIVLFGVALVELGAAVGWSVRLDKAGSCAKSSGSTGTGPCHIIFIVVATALAWVAGVISCCAVMCQSANHGGKKRRSPPLPPIDVSRPAISSPVIIHAGRFSENERDDDSKFISFAEIPLGPNRGVREMYS